MKYYFLILLSAFVFVNQSNGEDMLGYYITNTNDTLKVTFKIPIDPYDDAIDFDQLQWKVKYYDSTGRKKVLDSKLTKEIGVTYGAKLIKMIVCKNDIGLTASLMDNNFRAYLCVVSDGKMKLLKYYKTIKMGGGSGMSPSGVMTGGGGQYVKKIEHYVIQKENGKLFRPSANRF